MIINSLANTESSITASVPPPPTESHSARSLPNDALRSILAFLQGTFYYPFPPEGADGTKG